MAIIYIHVYTFMHRNFCAYQYGKGSIHTYECELIYIHIRVHILESWNLYTHLYITHIDTHANIQVHASIYIHPCTYMYIHYPLQYST